MCNGSVQFVLKNDRKKEVVFASLQSEVGQKILQHFNLPQDQFNSIVYYRGGQLLQQSTAVLYLLKDMGGIWPLFFSFIVIPPIIRNGIYNWIAKNRYKWFGQSESCMLPLPEYQERFIEDSLKSNTR